MYHGDHAPPHFHARYAGRTGIVGIQNVELLRGRLPGRALSMLFEWTAMHQGELRENWERAQQKEPLRRELLLWSERRKMDGMDTIDVVKVTVLGHYLLQVEFSDRTRRDVDLQGDLQGGIFEALADPALFAQAYVDGPGVEWPNGASLAPEFLYRDAKRLARA